MKFKEPQSTEWNQLREHHILFAYLHLAPDPEQAKGLIKSGCTAIAYETVTDARGGLPLLAPMSEVAGRLSIEAAGSALKRYAGGCGLLIGGVPGVQPARIVAIGGGVVGTHAARMAVGLGAEVTILDRSIPRLRELDELFEGRFAPGSRQSLRLRRRCLRRMLSSARYSFPERARQNLSAAICWLGCAKGSVIVDVAIDQGGCFETSRPTTHADQRM